ncbi:protease B nonderepressible form [Rhodotorula kratochvilovae]
MSGYTASFAPAGGLHPTLELFIAPSPVPGPSCALYTLVNVPPGLIADKYQLQQLHRDGRLGASSEGDLTHLGEADLEAPVWRAGEARVLLRLRDVEGKGKARARNWDDELHEVPLHLRYQDPVARRWVDGVRRDIRTVEVEWPWVFWACEAGALEDLPVVESVTAAAVWACFAFLCWTAVQAYRRGRAGSKEKKA